MLITSRIANWSAAVEPLELDVLAPDDAVAFLLERHAAPPQSGRRRVHGRSDRPRAGRPGPGPGASRGLHRQAAALVRRVSRALAGQASGRAPLARPAADAVPVERGRDLGDDLRPVDRARSSGSWRSYPGWRRSRSRSFCSTPSRSRRRFPSRARRSRAWRATRWPGSTRRATRFWSTDWCRRSAAGAYRGRPHGRAANRPRRRECRRHGRARGRPHLGIWTPLAPHAEAVSQFADAAGLPEPTARLMNQLAVYWQTRGQFRAPSRCTAGRWRSTSGRTVRTTPTSPFASTTWRNCCRTPTGWPRPSRCSAGRWRSTSGRLVRTTPTSPLTSTTWRNCCRPPTGWLRPSRCTAGRWRSTSGRMVRTTPTSPSASTTWRNCCGTPTGWLRPSRCTAGRWRSTSASYGPDHPNVASGPQQPGGTAAGHQPAG